jgi:hypothetical protein
MVRKGRIDRAEGREDREGGQDKQGRKFQGENGKEE